MKKVKKKKNKYSRSPKIPPLEFDIDYSLERGWSGKTEQLVKIAFHPHREPGSSEQILYFKIILRREIKGKFYHVVVFDTYHQSKSYAHGHRYLGTSKKRKDIPMPVFSNLKEGLTWVINHLHKHWNKYVRLYYEEYRKINE